MYGATTPVNLYSTYGISVPAGVTVCSDICPNCQRVHLLPATAINFNPAQPAVLSPDGMLVRQQPTPVGSWFFVCKQMGPQPAAVPCTGPSDAGAPPAAVTTAIGNGTTNVF